MEKMIVACCAAAVFVVIAFAPPLSASAFDSPLSPLPTPEPSPAGNEDGTFEPGLQSGEGNTSVCCPPGNEQVDTSEFAPAAPAVLFSDNDAASPTIPTVLRPASDTQIGGNPKPVKLEKVINA
jgi:hypothetical protein